MATVGIALRWAIAALSKTSTTAQLDAETLVMHITGFSRAELVTRGPHELSATQAADLFRLVERRATGEPIAYLTHTREFWSLELIVSPSTLIPRPETELLVEQALALIPTDVAWTIADLGTGCGAIALALAKERPRCHVVAIDNVPATLDIVQKNAWRHKLKNVEFLQGSWFEPLDARVNIVVSNPPYIRNDDPHLAWGDVRFEPNYALLGGVDGLDAIRHIVAHAKDYLYPDGILLLEHGYDQGVAVRSLMQHHGYINIACHQDIACCDRVSACQVR
ncbi:MAG: peptide chain release factor N(5)-glutamine methyltransferase [Acidiferrobacterales bacterium]